MAKYKKRIEELEVASAADKGGKSPQSTKSRTIKRAEKEVASAADKGGKSPQPKKSRSIRRAEKTMNDSKRIVEKAYASLATLKLRRAAEKEEQEPENEDHAGPKTRSKRKKN